MTEILTHVSERIEHLQQQGEAHRKENNHIRHLATIVAVDELLRVKKLIIKHLKD